MSTRQEPGTRPQPQPQPGQAEADPPGYRVGLSIRLPRDALSVPLIRHLARHTLDQVGVVDEVCADIELALTEACTNVLDHSGPGDAYEVSVSVGSRVCELRIIDVGYGFDYRSVHSDGAGDDSLHAERGRGLTLMQALVDHIELVSAPEEGTLVRMVKTLAFDDRAPARHLLAEALGGGRPPGHRPVPPYPEERADGPVKA